MQGRRRYGERGSTAELRSNVPDTILIVDDDEISRAIPGNVFTSDYRIWEAGDGKEGLDLLLSHPEQICAVLLDVVMPRMDGLELLEKLELLGMVKQIPVFLITAEDNAETLRRAYSLGVMDVIRKPIVPYIVKRRVDSVIELFRARKQLGDKVEEQKNEIHWQEQRIADLSEGMIEALATAIEFRNGESGEHVRRIRSITELLLTETELGAGLSQEDIQQIGGRDHARRRQDRHSGLYPQQAGEADDGRSFRS